jgi:hypothetical protein
MPKQHGTNSSCVKGMGGVKFKIHAKKHDSIWRFAGFCLPLPLNKIKYTNEQEYADKIQERN